MVGETQAQTLERFFRTLVDAVRESRSESDGGPLTVGEIYQDLVPYRVARSTVGFAMNADYEHALMLLLAGEGDFVRMDPAEAQRELRRELDTTNPDVTLYRKFAGCDVWLRTDALAVDGNGGAMGEAAPDHEAAPRPERPAARPAVSPPEPAAAARQDPPPEAPASAEDRVPPQPAAADAPVATCASCGEEFPRGRRVRFCPYCGEDQRAPCRECGEILDPGWRFCIVCGRRAASGA